MNRDDARLVENFLVGNVLSIPRPEDADVNHDGRVTTADAVLIMQFAVGLRTSFDFQSPRVVTVIPSSGTADVLVTASINLFFSEPVLASTLSGALTLVDTVSGQPVAGTIESSPASVAVNFVPSQPLLPSRAYRVNVTTAVTDGENNALQEPFASTFQTQALGTGVLVSTSGVEASINELLPQPVSFRALNASGQPVRQVPVTFTALMGAGIFEPSGKRQVVVLTDDTGLAQVSFRLGGQATEHTIDIRAPGFGVPPIFTARAMPLAPANLRVYSGNNQSGPPGGIAPFPLIVEATDSGGNPVAGTTVTFTVTQGQGQFAGQPSVDVPTNSSGTAATSFTFGATSGAILVQARFPGLVGQAPVFNLQTLVPRPSSPTIVTGQVVDAHTMQPLHRIYVYLADNPSTWDWTDEHGFFRLTTTPGAHTVDVDGFESGVIDGQLYPVVAIPVNAVEGQDNDIGMPALLPRLDIQSYIDVSDSQGGTLTLRSNPNWKLYVAPGQARFANGTGTGRLYVASVPPDRIPMPPAGGKISRFFDTIQPLNVRFEPPAAVTFPNADNLQAGTVTDIYTLSYTSGVFLKTGRGQVSEDGRLIVSLPGEGITAGGWHQAPPPFPSPTTCLEATLNLGLGVINPTMTIFGRSCDGQRISDLLWLFVLCDLPTNQGPLTPFVNAGSPPANSPPISGPSGPPSPYNGPPKDPPIPPKGPDDTPVITAVTFDRSDTEMALGDTIKLKVTLHFDRETDQNGTPIRKDGIRIRVVDNPPNVVTLSGTQFPNVADFTGVTDSAGQVDLYVMAPLAAVAAGVVELKVVIDQAALINFLLSAALADAISRIKFTTESEIDTSALIAIRKLEPTAPQIQLYLSKNMGRVFISPRASQEFLAPVDENGQPIQLSAAELAARQGILTANNINPSPGGSSATADQFHAANPTIFARNGDAEIAASAADNGRILMTVDRRMVQAYLSNMHRLPRMKFAHFSPVGVVIIPSGLANFQ